MAIGRPRARAIDAGELSLPTFERAAATDPLDRATMHAIAAGVSTRRYSPAATRTPPLMETGFSCDAFVRRVPGTMSKRIHSYQPRVGHFLPHDPIASILG